MTKETKQRQKYLTKTSFRKIMTSLPFFSNYVQFGEIRKPDSERIVCKTYIFINSNFLSDKNGKQNQKTFLTQLSYYRFD